jgi:DNA-binding HxlR family transcriptional regulator
VENTRSYNEACAIAHALDLVGDRWALLIIRELLFGPKRFTDLRAGLPGAGPNRLSQRLRALDTHGVIQRRKLAPPSASWVYELTDWGSELEPALVHLGRWGRRSPFRDLGAYIGSDSLMLALRDDFEPAAAVDLDATYAIRFGEDHFVVRVAASRIDIERGDPLRPDLTVETDTGTFAALITKRTTLDVVVNTGKVTLTGDSNILRLLLDALPRPEPANLIPHQ